MEDSEVRQYAPLTLAFYGDCVYEELVRREIVTGADMPVHALHDKAVELVCAAFQARAAEFLNTQGLFTDEEEYYFKRGRNASHIGTPKNSRTADYRAATGLETVFGYLALMGRQERTRELFELIRKNVPTVSGGKK